MNGELATLRDPAGQRLVVASERPRRDRDCDLGRLAWCRAHDGIRCERAERASPPCRAAWLGQVGLHDFLAWPAAGVADPHGELQVAAVGQPLSTVEGLIFPGRVAKAVTERVRRIKAGRVVPAVADEQSLGVAE